MRMIKNRKAGGSVTLVCIMILVLALTNIRVKATEKFNGPFSDLAVAAVEPVREFATGKLYKVKYTDHSVAQLIVFNNGKSETYDPEKHDQLFQKAKISPKLQNWLDNSKTEDLITVAIWITGIDNQKIAQAVKEELKIVDLKKESKEKLNLYLTEKRLKAKDEYKLKNQKFAVRYVNRQQEAVVFTSGYAPFIIVKLEKEDIAKLGEDPEVTTVDLFKNAVKEDEVTYSIPNITANYTRDTLNLKGNGVKVGVVESGYADKTNAQLADRDIIFDVPDSTARTRLSTHATIVSSLIVGKTQGIVPLATLYVVAALTRLQDYQKIEWLIDQGVTVINYSAGYSDQRGEYSDMAKWIDHLGNQHQVHFVKSAGNANGSNYLISDPGMAYNAIVTGSIYDHDSAREPYWNDDTLSTFSCYAENSGGYKPDLTAPGQGISVAGYSNYNGTSFAAPHVTAVLTQLLEYRSNLITNNSLLKAICAAGTFHRTATDYGSYSLSPYYSNQEGAGVVDAKTAYDIVANSTYADLELTTAQFPYEMTINVAAANRPVRVSLAWLKQNNVVTGSHPGATVTENNLSDLDLVIYGPSGNYVAGSMSAGNNLELVEFVPSTAGTYRIRVNGYAIYNSTEIIGLAWHQRSN
ncbi:MAG TPA: S8 family serine peptidase [Bacillota bacterium]